MSPRGRRPAGEDTRGAIIDAAVAEFSAKGYDGASLRGIARVAGVDPALVHHYFDGKSGLFVEAMQLPGNPGDLLADLLQGPPESVGERVVRAFFRIWEPEPNRAQFVGLLRSAVANDQAAAMLREFLTREVLTRIAAAAGVPGARHRASLAASQMIGVAVLRYLVGLRPLAEVDVEELVAVLAPTLQRYLTDPDLPLRDESS